MPNIYLIGMMGSGKTVTGQALAELSGKIFEDLDRRIEQKTQTTIANIFKSSGEQYFRLQEAACLKDVKALDNRIVATGGGAVLNPQNVAWMKESGKVVYLETDLDALWSRVKKNKDRPLLHGEDPKKNLQTIYEERKRIYQNAADISVATDGLDAKTVAQNILEKLGALSENDQA